MGAGLGSGSFPKKKTGTVKGLPIFKGHLVFREKVKKTDSAKDGARSFPKIPKLAFFAFFSFNFGENSGFCDFANLVLRARSNLVLRARSNK